MQITRQHTARCLKQLKRAKSEEMVRVVSAYHTQKTRSCVHFYKQELEPVWEAFVNTDILGQKSPYELNFTADSLRSMDLRKSLLDGLGAQSQCFTSAVKDSKTQLKTFYLPSQKPSQLNFDHFGTKLKLDPEDFEELDCSRKQSASEMMKSLFKTQQSLFEVQDSNKVVSYRSRYARPLLIKRSSIKVSRTPSKEKLLSDSIEVAETAETTI
jgi:hypothetical protein